MGIWMGHGNTHPTFGSLFPLPPPAPFTYFLFHPSPAFHCSPEPGKQASHSTYIRAFPHPSPKQDRKESKQDRQARAYMGGLFCRQARIYLKGIGTTSLPSGAPHAYLPLG
uniref:Uncharacterized protein n=1 Tax=Picea glauca TaxID=3330 RepID=A0A117NJ19_PICGL|nr:hypothetical protein ABT39_MTgene642 [Picea glauca]